MKYFTMTIEFEIPDDTKDDNFKNLVDFWVNEKVNKVIKSNSVSTIRPSAQVRFQRAKDREDK